ncbi:MAG: outer membrane protein assembly factor BamD [Gammaproteobacteria bacterium]|nr:MAG: outer membrane protein assembly factor BamD [Gammaproteobacteria bacterium]
MRLPNKTGIIVLVSAVILLAGCSGAKDDETEGWSANKLYSEARAAMAEEGYETAVGYYEKLEARYPFGQFAQQALLESAYAYYKDDEPELAIATADRFIKLYPRHPNVDYAYYIKGLTNFNRNFGFFQKYVPTDRTQRDQAAALQSFNDFSELLKRFPNSKYAEDAEQRMVYLRNSVAEYDVHVARYYIKRGAYLAAANRGRNVVENYPKTTAVPGALAVMLVSYTLLEMDQLAADAQRVLELNFPDHPVLKGEITAQSDTGKTDGKWFQFWE